MDILRLKLLEATDNGRLYYKKDPEIEPFILFISNPFRKKAAFSINISGGQALVSLDENRVLQSAEFIIHRRAWEKGILNLPHCRISADIQFPNVNSRHIELEMPIKAITDEEYSQVQILIGDFEIISEMEWVSLSDQCSILVASQRLKGIHINLTGAYPQTK